VGCEVGGTGSESCPVAGFILSDVEYSNTAPIVFNLQSCGYWDISVHISITSI